MYFAYVKTCPEKYEFQIPDFPNVQFSQEFIFDNSYKDLLHPTPNNAVVNLTIKNPGNGFLKEEINIRGTTTPFNNWKKRLFVVDVTGSMYAYAQQIKNWHILNFAQEDTSHFVFFNDGDETADAEKTVGSTSGIYFCENCGILEVERMFNIASKWDGGDIPENDIEALLIATDSISSYKELILLADNKSPVRDYVLLKQFNCRVRVVLCGVFDDIINEQYLNIAYKTKGSVHTIEQDIQFLRELQHGDEITLGKRKYLYLNNGFIRYK